MPGPDRASRRGRRRSELALGNEDRQQAHAQAPPPARIGLVIERHLPAGFVEDRPDERGSIGSQPQPVHVRSGPHRRRHSRRRRGAQAHELYPQRYPYAEVAVAVSRAQVKAELAEAIRTGDVMASGELGLKLNEEFPERYPAVVAVASTKTRDQVNAETREAIRNGDMYAADEGTTKLNEEFPQRYAKARALYAGKAQDSTASAASTLMP